ncbi:hypothetical protein O1157_09885 [Streptomyces albogriseolus]
MKAETSATAGQAKQAAGQVAGTAAEQARAVAGEARDQAGTVVQDLRTRAVEEADGQTRRAADTLRQWSTDLTELAAHAESDSPARSLAARAGDGDGVRPTIWSGRASKVSSPTCRASPDGVPGPSWAAHCSRDWPSDAWRR